MRLTLTITSYQSQSMGVDGQKSFDQKGGTLGRAFDNDWILPDPERIVSSHHGLIYFQSGTFYITDTSTNGVYLDGNAQAIGKDRSAPLQDGSRLRFGDYELSVSILADNAGNDHAIGSGPETLDNFDEGADAINAPGFDPLQHIAGADSSPDPFNQQEPAAQPNHSPAVNDFFEAPSAEQQEAFFPAEGSGQADANVDMIPEDWALTGFPPPRAKQASTPAPGAQQPRPTPARVEKPATPTPNFQPGPPQSSAGADLFEVFLAAAGVDPASCGDMNREQAMQDFGRLFRYVVQGLMELERSRSTVKSEFRMLMTAIRPAENNPLKFSPDADEALRTLFSHKGSSYLKPVDAITESIDDIRNHQIAMITGMQAAFSELIHRLQPHRFTGEENGEQAMKGGLMSKSKNARAWENYCQFYKDTVLESGNAFQLLFGEDFSRAYEEQVQRLRTARNKN